MTVDEVAHNAPGLYRTPVTKNSAIGPTAISTAADEGSRSEPGRCSVEMRLTSSTLNINRHDKRPRVPERDQLAPLAQPITHVLRRRA